MTDPFFVVRDEVAETVRVSTALFEKWQEILDRSDFNENELEWTASEINRNLKSVDWDVQDLEESINAVANHPTKFSIDATELANRRRFVQDTKDTIQRIRTALSSPETAARIESLKKKQLLNREKASSNKRTPSKVAYERFEEEERRRSTENFIENRYDQQQRVLAQQDQDLEQLGASVRTVREVATVINEELKNQNDLLSDVEEEMGKTHALIRMAQRHIDTIIKRSNDKFLVVIIVGLLVALAVLLFLIIGL